jgi:5-(hydroxymethyl)furfural/furfural oxidase
LSLKRRRPHGPQLDSDQAIDSWLPLVVSDYVHPVGTCRMGPPDEKNAVVDLDRAVRSYEALRVVDASVSTEIPRCNTHPTTVAVAERFVQRRRP